ncbi:MAG: AmmeMemoRadiSam system radical SAM enzyme [Planctomycetes bacterium]|nr:AmmeMemoRadiSam system radical SAM enzyme [Planctomycetota bacterium]
MADDVGYKEAVLWVVEGEKVRCNLCNWRCLIADGMRGHCGVRRNLGGVLYSLCYDKVCAASADPIEKKPLFHFLPGTQSYSISTPGCNFQCGFCQNWQISQMPVEDDLIEGTAIAPDVIVAEAIRAGCASIAYTYTEPTIFMELCADTGRIAKDKGLKNVFVSNGFMTIEAIEFARGWLDAINIDLKSFREDYYRDVCKAKLAPVLDTIRYIAKETDIWMELTTLVVPGENDSDQELKQIAEFIAKEAGADVPWHVSRFYPMYKMSDHGSTPTETMMRAYEIGKKAGLNYVYVGNLPSARAESTYCRQCGEMVIERVGYTLGKICIKDGQCANCQAKVAGRFD